MTWESCLCGRVFLPISLEAGISDCIEAFMDIADEARADRRHALPCPARKRRAFPEPPDWKITGSESLKGCNVDGYENLMRVGIRYAKADIWQEYESRLLIRPGK